MNTTGNGYTKREYQYTQGLTKAMFTVTVRSVGIRLYSSSHISTESLPNNILLSGGKVNVLICVRMLVTPDIGMGT